MTQADAFQLARAYAAEYDVPWVGVSRIQTARAWWYFKVRAWCFDIDTGGRGPANAAVSTSWGCVCCFEFRPLDPLRFWLPLWAAFPGFNSATIGWRMGNGEWYWHDWHKWYAALPEDRRAAYRQRYPEPDRNGWQGFYDLVKYRV